MTEQDKHDDDTTAQDRSSGDSPTLLPLLFVGLGMIIIGMIVVMALT
jgi:hypothetical protein